MAVKSGEKVRTFPDDIVGETGEGERVFPFSLARMSAQDTSLPAGRQGPPVGRMEKGNRKNKTGFPALFYFC